MGVVELITPQAVAEERVRWLARLVQRDLIGRNVVVHCQLPDIVDGQVHGKFSLQSEWGVTTVDFMLPTDIFPKVHVDPADVELLSAMMVFKLRGFVTDA